MPAAKDSPVDVQFFYGPPPVLPDVEKQLKEHLLCVDHLPIHNYENAQQLWPRQPNPLSLFHYELSPLGTTLKVDRDPTTGEVLHFREVPVDDTGCTAKNSMSLRRAPGPSTQSVKGSDSNFPFWPGGFPEISTQDTSDPEAKEINFEDDLLYIAPGFTRGIKFKADGYTPYTAQDDAFPQLKARDTPERKSAEKEASPAPSLMDIIQQEENLLGLWKETVAEVEASKGKDTTKTIVQTMKIDTEEELEVIPEKVNIPVLKISEVAAPKGPMKAEWAEIIDVSLPVTDFEEKIPKLAYDFGYELDTFQKQAILKVEEHCNVFVAAPTSAGKTVPAMYAIALSRKNMTRTVYTSPIKALSNQKYRDFRDKFDSVGLITGDIQLNTSASCLIMTTEILRSMLYQGSEVVRDLEYVIFDEVHYINNVERGHVWEETLILLPETVSIIMLSATVPNSLEFANWVGRTKQKKMFVILATKRPVPLYHFLYADGGSKSREKCFQILDEDGRFNQDGYKNAAEALDSKSNKGKDKFGPRQSYIPLTEKQETTMWIGMIAYLKKEQKLPAVAFTLSRKRCDTNASNLKKIDLIASETERHVIKRSFNKYLQRLKDPDKELPQVKEMAQLLERGIGVHHSGILPILKEIVEILFQKGTVKLLFATETFAMGVNMPARTVIFDSIRKFDGQGMRLLLPAEYIQMAGRAGRRDQDTEGSVIIMCKTDVPKLVDLKTMMLGKPEKLTSQFRLTYAMILRLLRVEKISVEDMMSRSFMEFGKLSSQDNYLNELNTVEDQIAKLMVVSAKFSNTEDFLKLYNTADEYIKLWIKTSRGMVMSPRMQKDLVPCRVVLVNHKKHINKLGMLLKVEERKEKHDRLYHVLVLCDDPSNVRDNGEIRLSLKTDPKEKPKEKSDNWYKMMALVYDGDIFVPNCIGHHTVLQITAVDIAKITKKMIKLDPELVLNDFKERQIPRFSNRPPRETCTAALQELTQLSLNSASIEFMDTVGKDSNYYKFYEQLKELRWNIREMNFASMANFEEQFETIFEQKQLEERRDDIKYLQSNRSMTLYPDYEGMVNVLRDMGYIEKNNAVDMKGRVAIKMRNNELIITELVFQNILTDMPVAEIAALLSSLVFQQKTNTKPKLTESLKKGKEIFEKIEKNIRAHEKKHQVKPSLDNQGLNFNLVEVVYEWAREKPFSEIIGLTDVQEGIIVRCIQQLNDTLRDVKDAASSVGDTMLSTKMEEASQAIKRDIVFAASLYTSDF